MKQVLHLVCCLLVVATSALAVTRSARQLEGYMPIFVSFGSTTAEPGAQVSITVVLEDVTPTSQAVTITGTAQWASLPSTVTVPAGYDSVTFTGMLRSDAEGTARVTAACNGGSVRSNGLSIPIID